MRGGEGVCRVMTHLTHPFLLCGQIPEGGVMPSSLGGLFKWVLATVLIVMVGTFIINRVGFLRGIIYPSA